MYTCVLPSVQTARALARQADTVYGVRTFPNMHTHLAAAQMCSTQPVLCLLLPGAPA